MRIRRSDEFLRDLLQSRSKVNEVTALLNGRHCLEWQRARHNLGYGKLWDGERLQFAHRLAWEANEGPIPVGLRVMHLCDNPRCVEIMHLKVGTARDNTQDMIAKGRDLAGRATTSQKLSGRPSHMRGEASPRSKLSKDEARAIKGLRDSLNVRATDVARKYGISESSVRAIWRGDLWGWLGASPNEDVGRISPLGPGDASPRVMPPKPERPRKYEINDPLRPMVKKLSLRSVLKGIAA